MPTRLLLVLAALVLTALASAPACNCGGGGKCTLDAQCDATGQGFSKCDLNSGLCICTDNRACQTNEFCNGAGRCQAESGCITNDDCNGDGAANLFCDISTQQCLSVEECNPQDGESCCTLDDQCPFNHICDPVGRKCVAGCRDNGDCIIGQGCIGAAFGRLGVCGLQCTDDSLCPPQYLCNLDTLACELDQRGPYCAACTNGVASDDCGTPGNYCLIDEFNAGAEFCGVECAQGQTCPSGYECQDVIIIPESTGQCTGVETCLANGACSRTGNACTKDEDCPFAPPWGDCPLPGGTRHGTCELDQTKDCTTDADCPEGGCNRITCSGTEGGQTAFCTCTRNSDCPADSCDGADVSDPAHPVQGHCELSGHPCFGDTECDVITCVDGGCFIGQNCAPSNDRSCAQLQQEQQDLTGGGTTTGTSP